jgi:hypothetical protein
MILLRKQRLGNGQASIAEPGDGKPDSVGLWSRTRLPRIAKLPLNMADRSSLQTIALLTAGDSFRFRGSCDYDFAYTNSTLSTQPPLKGTIA